MIKQLLKPLIFKTCSNNLIQNILNTQSQGCKILFYHGVELEIVNQMVQAVHVSFDSFKKQIEYLQNWYEFISLEDLYNAICSGQKINPRHVVLTFDDGYKNNLEVVFPFLDSLNIPFSVFISTKHIESTDRFPTYISRVGCFDNYNASLKIPCLNMEFDISTENQQIKEYYRLDKILKSVPQERVNAIISDIKESMSPDRWLELNAKYSSDEPMNWKDVDELHRSGVIIGSHCLDHCIVHPNQTNEEVDKQLYESKKIIEEKYGSCPYFCYPNGSFRKFRDISKYSYQRVKDMYSLALSTCPGEVSNRTDKYLLPRLGTPKNLEHFKFVMSTSFTNNRDYKKHNNIFHKGRGKS